MKHDGDPTWIAADSLSKDESNTMPNPNDPVAILKAMVRVANKAYADALDGVHEAELRLQSACVSREYTRAKVNTCMDMLRKEMGEG